MITLILQGIAVLFLLMIIGYKLLCIVEGDADLVLEKDTEKKFAKASRDEDSVTIRRRLTFRNRGKQAAVVSDCIARTQLAESFAGVSHMGGALMLLGYGGVFFGIAVLIRKAKVAFVRG